MIIKRNKPILIDEVKEFLSIMEKENENKPSIKNNYESKVNK